MTTMLTGRTTEPGTGRGSGRATGRPELALATRPRVAAPRRRARPRHYLMCPPTWFDVTYAINPWMDPTVSVDRARAQAQWDALVATHRGLGHRVDVLAPDPTLPDMVFTANGALVVDDRALVARFRHAQRRPESAHHLAWLRANLDVTTTTAASTIEAEGDLVVAGDLVLAGHGFRTDPAGHAEVAATFGRDVLSLELVDPCYYHLDVALAVLDESTVAWFPDAFSPRSRDLLAARFPDAVEVSVDDAAVLGCNLVSDGRHVLVDARAHHLADELRRRGFVPIPLEVDEFTKAGGGIKCLTMELHGTAARATGTDHEPTTTTTTSPISTPTHRSPR